MQTAEESVAEESSVGSRYVDRYPGALSSVVALLPTAALGEGLRAYAVGALPGWPLLSLSIGCALGLLAAWKGFRWTS